MSRRSCVTELLTAAAVFALLVQSTAAAAVKLEPYTLEEVTPNSTASQRMRGHWASGHILLVDHDDKLVAVDVEENAILTVVPEKVFANAGVVRARLSADEQYVLLAYDVEQTFRHAARARYMVYSRTDDKKIHIGGGKRLQLAKWGTRDSQLVYVYQNNIFCLHAPGAEPVPITSDGVPEVVFNGVRPSYTEAEPSQPEDTLGRDWAVEFSPDGGRLLFARSDVSAVPSASFVRYGRPGRLEHQYAQLVTFRYAKAGTPIATVALKVASLPPPASAAVTVGQLLAPVNVTVGQLLAPVDVVSEEHYLESMAWVNDTTVMACWTNRTANVRQDVIYFLSRDLKEILVEKGLRVEQKDGWVDVHPPIFQKGSQTTTYVTLLWHPTNINISFPHVFKVTENSTEAITSGHWTVTKIYGWAANGTIYYEATEEDQPSVRQVYAVEAGGAPRCLSCDFPSPEGNACQRASAAFSRDFSWCVITCKGPDPPFYAITATAAPKLKPLSSPKNNILRKLLRTKLRPRQVDDWIPLENGMSAHVRLLLPPDLEPQSSEKRPTIVCVDGFPGRQMIDDSFRVDLFSYLATHRRYVVALIDARGSGCHGDRTLYSVYRRLGSVDVDDQINVTRELTKRYPFIDSARIGIMGKGYGGYTAAMALARDGDNVFKCGASVAPITSWIYTDPSQSERYMGLPTPDDNEAGYNASDVTRLADRFAGRRFLLMHGTADDHVLFQNSMALATALQDAGVVFEQQSYPDEQHWLRGLQAHAYHTLDDFFRRCFDRSDLLIQIILERLF